MTPDQGDDDRRTGLGDIQDPVAALDAIAAEISVAREMLARGDAVDLHGMEVRVTRFCEQLASLPPATLAAKARKDSATPPMQYRK